MSKLVRPWVGRKIGGVCAGLSTWSDIDVSIYRVLFLLLTFFSGIGLLTYLIMWAVLPNENE